MGKKRTAKVIVEDKPEIWCFYCDREFEDERILIQHQKAKHFKCDWCTKKMQNAGGLVVHALQVHKETVSKIPNAKEDRNSVEYDVQGMTGIPDEFLSESALAKKRHELGIYDAPMFAPPPYGMPLVPPSPFGAPLFHGAPAMPPPPPVMHAPPNFAMPNFGAPPPYQPPPQFMQPPPMPPPVSQIFKQPQPPNILKATGHVISMSISNS